MRFFAGIYILLMAVVVAWLFREYMPMCTIESANEKVSRQECECTGWELTLRDDLEAGGVKQTTCLGVMKQRECFVFTEEGLDPVSCR